MIAVIFHRLGPYHFARLRAAGSLSSIIAVETSGTDETYAWDLIAGADGFERVTLFENADAQRQPACEVVRRMVAALDKIRPSVVVVPGWADVAALAALQWCAKNKIPAVCMSESTVWDEPRKGWKEFIKRQVVNLFSAGLAGGTPHKEYLVQLGMPAERVFLGYDAVDNDYFAAETLKVGSRKSEVRKKNSLPENYFLASNRFIEKKNLLRLIEGYARYRQLAENGKQNEEIWDLVLLGDGALRKNLEARRSELGVDRWVHLPGFRQYPELPEYYACARAFIHASTSEQWGLVVNEAMASGLPVLVSNRCGCARDLVQDGVNGFTFDPYDVEQLAQLMRKISAAPFPLSAFASASQRIIADWGPEKFAQGLKAAVECAQRVGPARWTLTQRIILKMLLWK
jgi:1,2-diacylglycerol 3-alpha-glucosyltransferase